jgi:ergothioneine biosynthesis protein EgtB
MNSTQILQQSNGRAAVLAADFLRVRQATIALTTDLNPEDCVIQTIPEVSPTKWHLAHTTWFFEQFCLLENHDSYRVFDERYRYLFNSYYYSVGQMHARPKRGLLNRPLFREILEYRDYVNEAMLDLIERRGDDDDCHFVVTLGLHHEQQHQELLLTDIKHVFFTNPLQPTYIEQTRRPSGQPKELTYIGRPGGRFEIGNNGRSFCFDNETPRHAVLLNDHELGDRLVTAGEFREFIDDGGYRDARLWMSDGWSRVQHEGWERPLYWSEDLNSEFTLSGWQSVDDGAPVCHVSQYEADAYARWADARLPAEAEWELAASETEVTGNTLDQGLFHPVATDESRDGQLLQLWGDVWEWTATPYAAYPGFKPLAGSLGEYNGKFMSNQIVVRGGSCASWAEHLRATYRSFFYPHDRWQFLGFRLARDCE